MNDNLDFNDPTPGDIIKKAREANKVTLNDAAQRLLLSRQIISDIEEDDYSKIPAQVYAEGYLRAYAQLLKISADELIVSFRKLNIYTESESPEPEEKIKSKKCFNVMELLQDRRNQLILAGFFIALLLLVAFGIKFKWFDGKEIDAARDLGITNGVKELQQEIIEKKEEAGVPVVTINVRDDVRAFGENNV